MKQRKCAVAAALRESEARYRALFEGMTEGFGLHEIICDEQGQPCDYRFLDINPSFERLTGLRREDVVGKTHNELLPDDSPLWVQMYSQVALTGQPVHLDNYSPALKRHYEVYAYCPQPRQFAVLFMDVTQSQVDSLIGYFKNATERKRAEQERERLLAQVEALALRDEAILDNMTEGLLISDLQGNILSLNPAGRRIHSHAMTHHRRLSNCAPTLD